MAPDEFLYGLPYVDQARFDVGYVDDPAPFARFSEAMWRRPQQAFGRRYGIGFNFHSYLTNRRRIQSADVLVTTNDSYGLPIAWWKSWGKVPGSIVYLCQGLYTVAHRARGSWFDERVRRRLGRWLRTVDRVVVLGEGDADAVRSSFPEVDPDRIAIIQFGIDAQFWSPAAAEADCRGGHILSVGSDSLRDYPVLLAAIGERQLRIVTRQPLRARAHAPNVTIDGDVDWFELRDLMRAAPFVVIPVKNAPRDSGHSATLQAMACGKAVILSDTLGLWDRGAMRHLDTCYLVPPGDSAAMSRAMAELEANPKLCRQIGARARQLVTGQYSSRGFGLALQHIVAQSARARGACPEETEQLRA